MISHRQIASKGRFSTIKNQRTITVNIIPMQVNKSSTVGIFILTLISLFVLIITEKLVRKLKKCNGNIKFTRLEGKGHAIHWIYEMEELYIWMLEQKKD